MATAERDCKHENISRKPGTKYTLSCDDCGAISFDMSQLLLDFVDRELEQPKQAEKPEMCWGRSVECRQCDTTHCTLCMYIGTQRPHHKLA